RAAPLHRALLRRPRRRGRVAVDRQHGRGAGVRPPARKRSRVRPRQDARPQGSAAGHRPTPAALLRITVFFDKWIRTMIDACALAFTFDPDAPASVPSAHALTEALRRVTWPADVDGVDAFVPHPEHARLEIFGDGPPP